LSIAANAVDVTKTEATTISETRMRRMVTP
jgi:hypothetical protein